MTSWADGPLLAGPVKAYRDHKAKVIIIETTKENRAGAGLIICRLPFDRVDEARAIVALPYLLRDAQPFAALGDLVDGEGEEPIIMAPAARLEITVGDIQRIAEARARAFPPVEAVQPKPRVRHSSGRKHRPKAKY
jgi:hypothetical protein